MFDWLNTQTVTRVRPARGEDRGDVWLDYSEGTAQRTPVEGVIIQPMSGQESQAAGRDATMAQYTLTDRNSPLGTWKDDDHIILEDGLEYQVVGHVQEWASPTRSLDHTYILLNHWAG